MDNSGILQAGTSINIKRTDGEYTYIYICIF